MLKSRQQQIPGGFSYFQPETGWNAPAWLTWEKLVDAVIKHRTANPRFNLPIDRPTVDFHVELFNVEKLRSMPGTGHFLLAVAESPPGAAPVFSVPPRRADGVVAKLKRHIANTTAGISLYIEWFGNEPVKIPIAEARAAVCLKCPKHVDGNLAEKFSEAAAKELKTVLGMLNDMEFKTSVDEKLKICSACNCPMKAKVWSPIDLILKHIRPEAKKVLWEKCWITAEEIALTLAAR